jgi:hypothetical protein
MEERQLRRLKPELDRFLNRYASLFDVNEMHARRMVRACCVSASVAACARRV